MNTINLKQIDELLKKNLQDFAKKNDLNRFATKDDLDKFATKKDLKCEIEEAVADIINAVEASKADKESLKELEERVKIIEDHVGISV